MSKRYVSLIIVLLLASQLFSQEKDASDEPGTAFFFDMGGKWFYSFNVDFAINKSNRYGFGISPVYGDIVPTAMYYYLGGEKSRFEIGGGIGYVIILTDEDHEEFTGLTFHGVLGYRYQKKDGLLFRIGFTPMYYGGRFVPWLGLSLGYSL